MIFIRDFCRKNQVRDLDVKFFVYYDLSHSLLEIVMDYVFIRKRNVIYGYYYGYSGGGAFSYRFFKIIHINNKFSDFSFGFEDDEVWYSLDCPSLQIEFTQIEKEICNSLLDNIHDNYVKFDDIELIDTFNFELIGSIHTFLGYYHYRSNGFDFDLLDFLSSGHWDLHFWYKDGKYGNLWKKVCSIFGADMSENNLPN